ncbi:tRNA pseudouridine(54/55) synthase Pus10 [Methanosphaera cuniculi]|uniref:tRNA pseudouridine(54/55) synthase Pus10 n=1 Tax=Methanosphaera cuniculi TaxID=1077256 RepID=UPI0026F25FDB|nr:tRNA pseudouridine(54/55) synthase Pus10 [Methanosphaera cuniculi]
MTQTDENNNDTYKICNECLHRIYPNAQRRANAIIPLIDEDKGEVCSLCNNILLHKDLIFDLVERKLNMLNITFDTCQIASVIADKQMLKTEHQIHKLALYYGKNNLRNQLKYEMCEMIEEKLHKTIDHKNPEIVIMIKARSKPYDNAPHKEVSGVNIFIDVNPLFIEGRYNKLKRGIPQTKWPCSNCKGRGCEECNFTGQQYPDTVEGLISRQILPLTQGSETKFHGSGREDIDVLMLGKGRPFVIEVKRPFNRQIDLDELEHLVNENSDGKIQIHNLHFTDKKRKGTIKNSSTESYKVYEAIAEFENGVVSEDIHKILKLKHIHQRTPQRVEHRRADLVREREIYDIQVERMGSCKLKLIIKCQGGLYIKELISGDDGRTEPSISSITGNNAVCSQLDVIDVHIPEVE